ncbi:MAG: riboflavin biosynthesis protein RibF [Coprobacillus sp.]|nr:riboflavin biosynthesis protein RibF [Coprobacillus sp.]
MSKVIMFKSSDNISFPSDLVLCLGYFDGVHKGHKALIEAALATGKDVAVLTLDRSPRPFLEKRKEYYLTSTADKDEYFSALGVKYLFVLEFNEETSLLSKDQFIHNVLDKINPSHIFVGEDYHFGFHGMGDPAYLSLFYKVSVIPLLSEEGEKISSHHISLLIGSGDVDKANLLLSHPYRVYGLVVYGLGNGKSIDKPTANLSLEGDYVMPSEGVYATYTYIGKKKYKSLTCISTHPTISELEKPIIETYILGADLDLYGKYIYVEFIHRIRDIFTYTDMEELKAQIERDEIEAKLYLTD